MSRDTARARVGHGGRIASVVPDERGAAIVEFALIVPIFLMIFMGFVQFGRAYNVQISLTGAAREGARNLALDKASAVVTSSTLNAAPGVCGSGCTITSSPALGTKCTAGSQVTLTVRKSVNFSFGSFLPFNRTLSGSATMRCNL